MIEVTKKMLAPGSGDPGKHRLEKLASRLRVRPSLTHEWAWVVGRAALAVVTGIGVIAFERGTPPFAFMLWSLGFVILYDIAMAVLLMRGRVYDSFFSGLVLDTVAVMGAWAVITAGLAEDPVATDLYLIMFPIVVVAVIRLGWPLGILQGTVFIVWMAATTLWFMPADFYAVDQMPIRVLFLSVTMGLTLWLMARLNHARDEAEDLARERSTLAEMSRVIGSTLELGDVYDHFASLVQDLVPYRRISVNRFDPDSGQLEHVYSRGETALGRSTHIDGDLLNVVQMRAGALHGEELTGGRTSMAVPLISGDRAIGVITTEAPAAATYSMADLGRLERVAHQISSAIESSRLAEVLVSSETRLRSVLDSSRDAVITVDPAGAVTSVNAGAASMFGYPGATLEGMVIENLVPVWSAFGTSSTELTVPAGKNIEVEARRSNGSLFPTETVIAPLSGQEGFVITLRDITERKTQEDARMRLLQTVSHELRTPLSAVLGAKDLLTSSAPADLDSFTFKRLMGVMERGVDRLDTLGQELTNLVDLIDMQRGTIQLDRELVRVSNLVDTAMAMVEPALQRHDQSVRLLLDNPGTELWADRGRMVQIINSLLMNAHLSSPRGATIVASGRIFNRSYELKVIDQGPHIAPEDEPYIFDPYSRAAREDLRSNEVRGFRLAIARGFVEAHGGEIGFNSSQEGSEFYIRIPIDRPAAFEHPYPIGESVDSLPAEADNGSV